VKISKRRQALATDFHDLQQETLAPFRASFDRKRNLIEAHLKKHVWILKDLVPPGEKIISVADLVDLYLLTGTLLSYFLKKITIS